MAITFDAHTSQAALPPTEQQAARSNRLGHGHGSSVGHAHGVVRSHVDAARASIDGVASTGVHAKSASTAPKAPAPKILPPRGQKLSEQAGKPRVSSPEATAAAKARFEAYKAAAPVYHAPRAVATTDGDMVVVATQSRKA